MKESEELYCQQFTEEARFYAAVMHGIERGDQVIREQCDICHRWRGIGYILFTENGKSECYFVENYVDFL